MQKDLEAQYDMTEGSTLRHGEESYRVTFLRMLKIIDSENNAISKMNLHSPIWPLPIFDFWIIAALGGILIFFGIADSVIPGGLFPSKNRFWKRLIRFRTVDKFNIITKQTGDEIYLILLELTEPPERGIRVNCNIRKSFVGSVEKGNFKISPILNYRNSFVPTFTGSISETETESVINIYARPQIFARIFMTIWMAFLGLILLVGILRIIMDGFQSFLIMPFILIVFGYGLSSILFWREEQKARQILEKAFHQT